jgi:hypothetical protein
MGFLTHRTITPEYMDSPDVGPEDLSHGLAYIRKVNQRFGGIQAVLRHLKAWSQNWPSDRPITILDIATGSADIPLAIVKWARSQGKQVRITAVDLQANVLAHAARHIQDEPWITLVSADALKLPYAKGSFDYATTSMFLHHLHDIEVMTVLKSMSDIARRGMIWNDLTRDTISYSVIKATTIFAHPIIRHDAVVSIKAGFTRKEVLAFRDRLDLHTLHYHGHWALRFTLAGEFSRSTSL